MSVDDDDSKTTTQNNVTHCYLLRIINCQSI